MPSRSCSKISAHAISRAAIAFLEGLPSGNTKVKTKDVLKQLADSLGCNLSGRSSDEYAKFKDRWKKALEAFRERSEDPSVWLAFKKKYEKGGRAKVEVSKIIQSPIAEGELSTLDSETIVKLAKMCHDNKPREAINKRLARHKITLLGGQNILKVNKADLCDAILTLAGGKSEPEAETCDVKTNTVAQLKAYIQSRGWSVPSKARKAEICQYIAKMESGASSRTPVNRVSPRATAAPTVAPINVPLDTSFSLPPGYENCPKSRALSKQKIKEWVIAQGWDKEQEFEGFPSDRKDKTAWCDFLSKLIATHQVSAKRSSVSKAPVQSNACYEDRDWKTEQDVEANLASCPPNQICDITKKRCLDPQKAEQLGLERYEVKLKTGRMFPIYVNKDQLRLLEPNLRNFITKTTKPVTPRVAPIVAPVITPLVTEVKVKPKAKIVFKPGKVQYGEEEKKRQAEASSMLANLIGEEEVPESIALPESVVLAPAPAVPIVTEEPSAIVKLRQRLKDVRVQPQPPPIQIVRAESELARSTAMCAGIKS